MNNKISKFFILFIMLSTVIIIPIIGMEFYFVDIDSDSWYYNDVMTLSKEGIINGYEDSTYKPDNNVTNAEFTKLLVTILDLELKPSENKNENWADKYINAALKAGIIKGKFDNDKPITRVDVARMIVLGLKLDEARIDNPFTDISDIYANTVYNEYLMNGYTFDSGVLIFGGKNNITRAEAAAVISRVKSYKLNPYEYKKEMILYNAQNSVIDSESQLMDYFCLVNREFITEFKLFSTRENDDLVEIYQHAQKMNPNLFLGESINYTYQKESKKDYYSYTFTIKFNGSEKEYKKYNDIANSEADAIANSIFKDGMTELEKLKAIHDYIVLNCQYDYTNFKNNTLVPTDYMAYGVLVNKTAVCQGYTATFNMLCEKSGIRSLAITGSGSGSNGVDHSWNMVLIDDEILFVDVTFDDPIPDRAGNVVYTYFAVTASELSELGHSWDSQDANIKYFF